jgi:ethanolamine transporter EutH
MARSNYEALGVNFVWLALILEAAELAIRWIHFSFDVGHLPILGVLWFLFWWFVTAKVVGGQTWARVVYLVFTILGVLSWVLGFTAIALIPGLDKIAVYPSGLEILRLLDVLELILQVAGIGMLFQRPASGPRAYGAGGFR